MTTRATPHLPLRYAAFAACCVAFLLGLLSLWVWGMGWLWTLGFAALCVLGVSDLRQQRHAVLRNYPVIGHFRFLLEYIRPEIRQYFLESDTEAAPFSRAQRSLVYARAKGQSDDAIPALKQGSVG